MGFPPCGGWRVVGDGEVGQTVGVSTMIPWVFALAWGFSLRPLLKLAHRKGWERWVPHAVIAGFALGAPLTVVTYWALR